MARKRYRKKKKKADRFAPYIEKYQRADTVPPCRHFGTCGGCLFQNIEYSDQLLMKADYLNDLLEDIVHIDEVHGTDPFHYRNRMDMVTAFGKFGLRERGNYRFVADIESCPLMQKQSNEHFRHVRPLVLETEQYNYLSHEGYLRYVVFREGKFTGDTMVNFVVSREENNIRDIMEEATRRASSVSLLLSGGLADLSFGPVVETIKGGHIEEDFDGIKYRIGPNSFFQSNSAVAKIMYSVIRDNIKGRVLDLYSGVGSISLYIASAAESVTGVEIIEEASTISEENRALNNIENAHFINADVLDYLKESEEKNFNTIILDPPRSGLHPKVLKEVLKLLPERILYMSCNPSSFKNEFTAIGENYSIQYFKAFDMFPQTPHVETLTVLDRK